ncbi:MFS transporter [Mycolicibacterium mageritense]|uniref:MFS transporter n=1 Tax=Mycolicibacterium mageritense TaxID=53462 RepID=UPI0011D87934|nr:MFS transporter [Mycolicibacterium mageritense]TXI63558.1 MAG: MFS transporter [Mycolicibacterium mageritense]
MTRRQYWPLYAAGFVTAFGAHSIAANLGTYGREQQASLLTIGLLLAVYDGAEVILKPVFGALVDRIGPRPVLIGGLIGFAAASAAFVAAGDPGLLGVARFGQGAAAAAFSPAASTLVARLTPAGGHGRRFGSYGAWKGLGYTLGPLLGGALVVLGGFTLLFTTLCGLAVVIAIWSMCVVPKVPALPRRRSTVVDLARRLKRREFVVPTLVLAASTAALAQPWAGRALDARRLTYRAGATIGLSLCAAGFAVAAAVAGPAGLLVGAIAIGAGAGMVTPLGFAALAGSTPAERLGETMGSAEVGRELGDAGGPLVVGVIAAAATLGTGLVGAAIALGVAAAAVPAGFRRRV